jgi:hypothetical protein
VLAGDARIHAVLDEGLLHRWVGGKEALVAQLRHFLDLAKLPNVEIRIIPFAGGWHAGLAGSFSLFDLPEAYPSVGYLETPAGMILVEGAQLDRLRSTFDTVRELSLDSNQSGQLITTIRREFDDQ